MTTQEVVPRTTLSLASQGRGGRTMIYRQRQTSRALQREVQRMSTLEHGSKEILGKAAAFTLNTLQLTLWPH